MVHSDTERAVVKNNLILKIMKKNSRNKYFIAILADVRNFWRERITARLPKITNNIPSHCHKLLYITINYVPISIISISSNKKEEYGLKFQFFPSLYYGLSLPYTANLFHFFFV